MNKKIDRDTIKEKDRDIIKEKIEKSLKQLDIHFSQLHYVDDIDDSLDYKVELPATGISKVLKTIPCIFFVNLGNKTANLIALNIYRIEEEDSLNNILSIVNEANARGRNGTWVVFNVKNGENIERQIGYRSTVFCGSDFNNLNEESIKAQYDFFIANLNYLIEILFIERKRNN